jgi:hypothetical protein
MFRLLLVPSAIVGLLVVFSHGSCVMVAVSMVLTFVVVVVPWFVFPLLMRGVHRRPLVGQGIERVPWGDPS